MNLYKWTKDVVPKFPQIVEKLLGKKIEDEVAPNEHVVTMPSVNIADRSSSFELTIAIPELEKKRFEAGASGEMPDYRFIQAI